MSSNMIINGNGELSTNGTSFMLQEVVIVDNGKLYDVDGNLLLDLSNTGRSI